MPSPELRLLPGKALLRLDPDEDRVGLIYVPDVSRKRSGTARCIWHEPSTSWEEDSCAGKRVVYEKWAGKPVTFAGVEYYIVDEGAILATLEEDES